MADPLPREPDAIVDPAPPAVSTPVSTAVPPSSAAPAPASFTPRAIVIGSLLAVGVNLVTPYNDFVVANTFFVGSYLPLAMILAVFMLVIVGNSLYRLASPAKAYRTGEMSVVLLMLLVACSFPSQGLMRGLLPTITTPFYFGDTSASFWSGIGKADLRSWLFPAPLTSTGRASDVIRDFYSRTPDGEHIPYAAWLVPMLGWGLYFFGLMITLIALAYLLRIQWADNERLPFPLAQVQLSLIEQPEPGQALNKLFRRRSFWIVTALIFCVHSFNALHLYFDNVPELLAGYNLRRVLADRPWSLLDPWILKAQVYFTFIGMAFFIRSRTAFSIWATYLIFCAISWQRSITGSAPFSSPQVQDQHLGACAAFAVGMLWIGRKFYWQTLCGALGFDRGRLERNAILAARWGIVGVAIMLLFFALVGASPWLAVLTISVVLLAHVVTSRIVAETGMPYVRANPTVLQVLTTFNASSIGARDMFFGGAFSLNGAFHTRESAMAFSQHGFEAMHESNAMPTRRPWKLAAVLLWTIVISYAAASWSSLTCYYSYVTPISRHMTFTVLNEDILLGHVKTYIVTPMEQHQTGAFPPRPYDVKLNVAAGFVIVAALQIGAWSFAGWPLLPVGFLMVGTTYIGSTWFSIMLGWLAKVVLMKIGGPKLLESARPAFIGLIFGECLAAAAWTVLSLVLAVNGFDYYPYAALPR